ncbi:MAG: hypothetical protein WCR49_07790 [Opitutae bacterium]
MTIRRVLVSGSLNRSAPPKGMAAFPNVGFALLLTLSLLSLLVLVVLSLSALAKVNARIAAISVHQAQARQNALLGLRVGWSELQRLAGEDARLTAMAGITGITAQAASSTRHWCGVWEESSGAFLGWLVSGAQATGPAAVQPGLATVELIGSNTVGAAAANSEHVVAGKIPIAVTTTIAAPGIATPVGSYAYLVLDEGLKISAYAAADQLSLAGVRPQLSSTAPTSAAGKLAAALHAYASKLPGVLSYTQLSLLPHPGPALTPSVLQDNFHHVTLTAQTVGGGQYWAGNINFNTTSTVVWRSLLETYNTVPGSVTLPAATLAAQGNALANGLAATTLGKAANGPFRTVNDLGTYLASYFPPTGLPTHQQIMDAISPLLTVRSDTFRLRAYGEALNPADATKTEAVAFCEAIVQRTPGLAPNGLGRKFIILSFRWLGPGDL